MKNTRPIVVTLPSFSHDLWYIDERVLTFSPTSREGFIGLTIRLKGGGCKVFIITHFSTQTWISNFVIFNCLNIYECQNVNSKYKLQYMVLPVKTYWWVFIILKVFLLIYTIACIVNPYLEQWRKLNWNDLRLCYKYLSEYSVGHFKITLLNWRNLHMNTECTAPAKR